MWDAEPDERVLRVALFGAGGGVAPTVPVEEIGPVVRKLSPGAK